MIDKQQASLRLDKQAKVSRQQVSEIQKRALGKLRRKMYALGYKAEDFLDTPRKRN